MQVDAKTSATDQLIARRKKVVSNGVGIFAPTSAVRASGAALFDADGREWIDFGAGIGVVTAGHCPPPVVEAIKKQADQLLHACFHVSSYEPYVQLCEKLAEILPHGEETKVMLTNTGAESVENAVKIARQYTGRPAVICYSEAFHGRSLMSMTLTSKISYKAGCGPFAPEVYRIPFPNLFTRPQGLSETEFVQYEINRLRHTFETVVPAKEVAAIIIEPVQGEGGFNVVPAEYFRALREICTEHGIVLIADEVQSGFCRTGKWGAFQHYGVTPDLSTWAKALGSGMPIGAVIGKAEVMDGARPGSIGGTYPGNPVCCAAALATLQYMEQLKMNERAQAIGKRMKARFEAMMQRFPDKVGDVRGLGAMLAIELIDGDKRKPGTKLTDALLKYCWDRQVLVLVAGIHRNIVRVLVPLVIEDAQLDQGLDIIESALENCHG